MNARLRVFTINPAYSALFNFAVGMAGLLLVICVTTALHQAGSWRNAGNAPWWAWCGGLIGACFITAGILIVPHVGTASYSVAVIAGQLIGAVLLDQFGWLNMPQFPISLARINGVLLLLAGVWLIQRN
jgi:transporter family-2 protein